MPQGRRNHAAAAPGLVRAVDSDDTTMHADQRRDLAGQVAGAAASVEQPLSRSGVEQLDGRRP